jgi:hypothetical protein
MDAESGGNGRRLCQPEAGSSWTRRIAMLRFAALVMLVVAFALLVGAPILSAVSEAVPLTISSDSVATSGGVVDYTGCPGVCRKP